MERPVFLLQEILNQPIANPLGPSLGELPKDPACACVMVYADVGIAGKVGADTFYFSVCTRKWLERELERKSVVFGHGRVIVEVFDWEVVTEAIEGLVRGIEATTWEKAIAKLRLVASWEREGL